MAQLTAYDQQTAAFGKCIDLLFQTKRRSFSIAAAHVWLIPAIRLGQIFHTETSRGHWTSYVTWAYLTEDQSQAMLTDPPFLHLSEWNAGDQLWFMDAVSLNGEMPAVASLLKREMRPKFGFARRLIRDAEGKVKGVRRLA